MASTSLPLLLDWFDESLLLVLYSPFWLWMDVEALWMASRPSRVLIDAD